MKESQNEELLKDVTGMAKIQVQPVRTGGHSKGKHNGSLTEVSSIKRRSTMMILTKERHFKNACQGNMP